MTFNQIDGFQRKQKKPTFAIMFICALQHFRDRLFQQAPPSRDVPVQSGGSSAAGKGPAESHGERQNGADCEKIVSSFYCVVIPVILVKSFVFIFGYFIAGNSEGKPSRLNVVDGQNLYDKLTARQ